MVSFVRNLLGLTILAVFVSTGYAIHCYRCNSIQNYNNCKENPITLIDCNNVKPPDYLSKPSKVGNATGCMKITVTNPVMQRTGTEYNCYFGDVSNKQGCELSTIMKILQFSTLACDVCTEDGCNGLHGNNGSGSLAPIAGAIILFLGIVYLFV